MNLVIGIGVARGITLIAEVISSNAIFHKEGVRRVFERHTPVNSGRVVSDRSSLNISGRGIYINTIT